MSTEPTYTVFEAVNDKLKEIFITGTSEPIFAALSRLRERPPETIKHWDLNDITNIRSVEFHLTHDEAKAFLVERVKTAIPPGWSYLTDKTLNITHRTPRSS